MAKIAAEVEQAEVTYIRNVSYLGPDFLAVLHFIAAKDKDFLLQRMFADFGATPFSKTVPVMNGGVDVPEGPGLGAHPEDDLSHSSECKSVLIAIRADRQISSPRFPSITDNA
jgi:L-alanine-DL-glutamate epimerase-like enolase superfamily enzyme